MSGTVMKVTANNLEEGDEFVIAGHVVVVINTVPYPGDGTLIRHRFKNLRTDHVYRIQLSNRHRLLITRR